MDRLAKYAPEVLGVTRALAGILFACHGAQKLLGAFGGPLPGTPPAIVWIAGLVELLGGVLLTLGLFAREAAFVSSGLLAVAYFMAHARAASGPSSTTANWRSPTAGCSSTLRRRARAPGP